METVYRFLFFVGGTVCHQLSDRSFAADNRQLPLCSRCTGIYLGFALCYAASSIVIKFNNRTSDEADKRRSARIPCVLIVSTLTLLLLPLEVDGVGSLTGLIASSSLVRAMTGVLFGSGISLCYALYNSYDIQKGGFTIGYLHMAVILICVILGAALVSFLSSEPVLMLNGILLNLAASAVSIAGLLSVVLVFIAAILRFLFVYRINFGHILKSHRNFI